MRMKVFILASILMCIFVKWHISIAYAEGADTLTIGENFVFNEIRAGKLSDYSLYEYWREKPGKIEICINVGNEEKHYKSEEDVDKVLNLLSNYEFQYRPGSLMNFELYNNAQLVIGLNDEYENSITICDSGYVYRCDTFDSSISRAPFTYAVACNAEQLCGLINNLYAQDIDLVGDNIRAENGDVYIDNSLANMENKAIFDRQAVFIPLRSTLETLGADVKWDSKTGNVHIMHRDSAYTLSTWTCYNLPQLKYVKISDDKSTLALYDLRGLYADFDDRIYLQNSTFSAFLEKLGYKCNVDMQNLSVNIITQGN